MFLPFKTTLKEYVVSEGIIYTDTDHAGAGYCTCL